MFRTEHYYLFKTEHNYRTEHFFFIDEKTLILKVNQFIMVFMQGVMDERTRKKKVQVCFSIRWQEDSTWLFPIIQFEFFVHILLSSIEYNG